MKSKLSRAALLLMLLPLCGCGTSNGANNQIKPGEIATTRQELMNAISNAKDGETIYVDDIDLSRSESVANSVMRIGLSKSVTIKSGKKTNAILKNGCFNILGSKITGNVLDVIFENIDFDGGMESDKLTDDSFYYKEEQDLEPWNEQYAANFKGNIKAKYSNCTFENYLCEYGAAMWARYADYEQYGDETLSMYYGDYSGCTLDLELDNCEFKNNSAYYAGGALMFEGTSKNINVKANKCEFTNNHSGCLNFTEGGGAIRMQETNLELSECTFTKNNGSHSYGQTLEDEEYEGVVFPATDNTLGGAISMSFANISAKECLFEENKACEGGAVAMTSTCDALFDGCVFKGNIADSDVAARETSEKGPWSNMGLGGGIYINSADGAKVEVINSSFYDNQARNGYGAYYSFYSGGVGEDVIVNPTVDFKLCTYLDNITLNKYSGEPSHPWSDQPGDLWAIPYIKSSACLVIDETFKSQFPRAEKPSKDNNYCYYGSKEQAQLDGVILAIGTDNHLKASAEDKNLLAIPGDYASELVGNRYFDGSPSAATIGSNYSTSLFHKKEAKKISPLVFIIPALVVVVTVLVAGVIFHFFRKRKPVETKAEEKPNEGPAFAKEDIDQMVNALPEASTLTEREREVLKLMLEGKKRVQIAETLFLSISAIKKYTTSLYAKLGVKDRIELVAKVTKK